jgi:plasmid stabilization system protein ParE
MASLIVAPEAEDDIFQIWKYLATEAGPETADRMEREIVV